MSARGLRGVCNGRCFAWRLVEKVIDSTKNSTILPFSNDWAQCSCHHFLRRPLCKGLIPEVCCQKAEFKRKNSPTPHVGRKITLGTIPNPNFCTSRRQPCSADSSDPVLPWKNSPTLAPSNNTVYASQAAAAILASQQ